MKSKKPFDSPQLSEDDSLKVELIEHPFKFKGIKDKKTVNLIVNTINYMGGIGENAEKKYKRFLKKLKVKEKKVIVALGKEYFDVSENQYLDRWSLIQLLCDLKSEITLPIFKKVISQKIPKEKSKHPHSFTTVGEEIMIRTTAIEGIVDIVKNYKSKKALEVLLENINHSSFSIKRASIQGYLESGDKNTREVLLKKLKKQDHHILKIKRVNVKKIQQATGGLFLKSNDTDSLPKLKNK